MHVGIDECCISGKRMGMIPVYASNANVLCSTHSLLLPMPFLHTYTPLPLIPHNSSTPHNSLRQSSLSTLHSLQSSPPQYLLSSSYLSSSTSVVPVRIAAARTDYTLGHLCVVGVEPAPRYRVWMHKYPFGWLACAVVRVEMGTVEGLKQRLCRGTADRARLVCYAGVVITWQFREVRLV